MLRHPQINRKKITNLTKAGANVTEKNIRDWFSEVEELLREENVELSIFNDPTRIFNFDESGFRVVPKQYKALCERNAENTYFVTNNNEKESYTVLFGSSAAGDLTPPMILYAGKRMHREIAQNVPDGWSVGISDDGWQTTRTFYEYVVNDLYRWLIARNTVFPIIIFVDGHTSHVSPELAEFCTKTKMMLIALYPNSTRFLQPLDRLFFGPFKAIWFKVLRQYLMSSSNAKVNKTNFGNLMKISLDNFSNAKSCLQKAFKICGLCPWNVEAINFRLLPTNAVTTPSPTPETAEKQANPNANMLQDDVYRLQLKYVELGLEAAQISRFLENRNEAFWNGPLEELALFNFWKTIKDKSEGLYFTNPLNPANSTEINLTIEENGDCTITSVEPIDGSASCMVEGDCSMLQYDDATPDDCSGKRICT